MWSQERALIFHLSKSEKRMTEGPNKLSLDSNPYLISRAIALPNKIELSLARARN